MKRTLSAVLLALILLFPAGAFAAPINLELALGVDVSGSVSSSEYTLQRDGYVNAFNNIASFGSFEPFAVTYYEWSSSNEQQQLVDWTLISTVADAQAFASVLSGVSRAFGGVTGVGAAINYGVSLFDNAYEGTRLVLDLSGDGSENDGGDVPGAVSAAESAGVTINGLPIGSSIADYYLNNVITSDGFIQAADDFDDFESAIALKLEREITEQIPTPEPTSIVLVLAGLLSVIGVRRMCR
ncbi:DUF1194 domain-containing protein [Salidesulfovibrio brasiliensis]|uniref:DUF1194 domain-containing protein n=1 Tax=Salidesulfovibrio brasiliensis TaxID=221711 RepID=UPI0006D1F221|nr:DUF1194 domain-containing protein [Salidesulfovibrio brasiliensis]